MSEGSIAAKAVTYAISKGYEVAPGALKLLQKVKSGKLDPEEIISLIIEEKINSAAQGAISESDLIQSFPELFSLENKQSENIAWVPIESDVEVIHDPSSEIAPTGIEGFSGLFRSRYEKLLKILKERPESRQIVKSDQIGKNETRSGKGLTSIKRVAGLVYSKRSMKNGIELVIDDDMGQVSLLALGDEVRKAVDQLLLDQCVMVEVDEIKGRAIAKSVISPDIPKRVFSSSKKVVYAVFLSDLHVGSNKFLEEAFARFLEWIQGKTRHEEIDEEIIRRLKYVVIGGDVVDGVGIFPNQEYELLENNVYRQYQMVSTKLAMIPKHLQVLLIPGNHDSTRQALPQPLIPRKYAGPIYDLPNITMLGDPSFVKLHGVSVLVYHGRSLDDVLATTPGLTYEQPTGAMQVLLRARHLAPTFGSRTPIAPEVEDHLVIDQVPDIFHSGHVHSVGYDYYKGSLMINSGTWQAQTGYQKNLGIMPRPGLVPIVNLSTLEVHLREFLTTR